MAQPNHIGPDGRLPETDRSATRQGIHRKNESIPLSGRKAAEEGIDIQRAGGNRLQHRPFCFGVIGLAPLFHGSL